MASSHSWEQRHRSFEARPTSSHRFEGVWADSDDESEGGWLGCHWARSWGTTGGFAAEFALCWTDERNKRFRSFVGGLPKQAPLGLCKSMGFAMTRPQGIISVTNTKCLG